MTLSMPSYNRRSPAPAQRPPAVSERDCLLLENALKRALPEAKLSAHILRTVVGPYTITSILDLVGAKNIDLEKLLGLGRIIETQVKEEPVRVYMDHGYILVEKPNPAPRPVHVEDYAATAVKGVVNLKVFLGKSPVDLSTLKVGLMSLDFEKLPHLALTGATGGGKSTLMASLAWQAAGQNDPRDVSFLVIAMKPGNVEKPGSLLPIQSWPHTWDLLTDPGDIMKAVNYLVELQKQRAALGRPAKHIFVFIDDLYALLQTCDIAKQLAILMSMGRDVQIHVIFASQRLSREGAGSALVTANATGRIVFLCPTASDAALYAGRKDSGAHLLTSNPGDAVLVYGARVQRLALGYVAPERMWDHRINQPRPRGPYRPWEASTGSTASTGADADARFGGFEAENGSAPVPAPIGAVPALPERRQLPFGDITSADDVAYVQQVYAVKRSLSKTLEYIGWGHGPNNLRRLKAALGEE